MSFAQRCGHRFDDMSKKRGRQLYDRNRVRVKTVGPANYEVQIQVDDGQNAVLYVSCVPQAATPELAVRCSCRRDPRLQPCKHLWAALLELDRMGASVQLPSNKSIQIVAAELPQKTAPEDLPGDNESSPAVKKRRAPPVVPVSDNTRIGAEDKGAKHKATAERAPAEKNPPTKAAPPRVADGVIMARKETDFTRRWRHQIRYVQELHADAARSEAKVSLNSLAAAHEIWFVLDIEATLDQDQLVVAFFERYQAANGNWVPLQRLKISKNTLKRIPGSEDRQLIEILMGEQLLPEDSSREGLLLWSSSSRSSEPAISTGKVLNSLQDFLLPRLCATNRFVATESAKKDLDFTRCTPLKWQSDSCWQYELTAETQRMHGVWRFSGRLVQNGKSLRLSSCQLFTHSHLVLMGDTLSRLAPGSSDFWATTLGSSNQIVVPFEDGGDFLSHLSVLPKDAWPQLPADLDWDHEQTTPQGRITIHAVEHARWKNRLAVGVQILYGTTEVRPSSTGPAVIDREQRKIYTRYSQLERKLIDDLEEFDLLVEEPPPKDGLDTQYALESRHLEEFVARASELGFQVVADGFILRRISDITWNVTSDIDWFNVKGTIDFEGREVALPAILAAVKRGEKYLNLGDGTYGMLPREWLDRMLPLAVMADRQGDLLRFQVSQTMLLDSLLNGQQASEVKVDDRFQELRSRLRDQTGLTTCPAPPGFQGELRKYQVEGVAWMRYLHDLNVGGCLADDMGLGKTIQVLCWLEERRTRAIPVGIKRKPSLVIVPRSLIFNWIEEAKRFTPHLRVLNYSQPERSGLKEQFQDYDLIIATYGVVRRDIEEWRDQEFDYAILDEAQAIKNYTSQASKAVRLIRADHRLAMTGTPVENHLGELWSLFEFLNPGMLGSSKTFLKSVKNNSRKGQETETRGHWLAPALRPFILRRTKKQVLTELPPRTQQTLHCEMDPAQRRVYDQILDYYRVLLLSKVGELGLEKSKIHVLEALLRLRQVACHPGLISSEHELVPSAKMDLLLEQIDELLQEDHKVLIFSQFTKFLGLVRKELDQREISYEYLDGQTKDRQQCVERFQQDPNCRLFLISLKAGGHGLNLTAADYVFILDPWWNPAVEAQAIDRAYRMGQTRHVFAYRMICKDTVEEKILSLQTNKQDLADSIIGDENSILRDLTEEDLRMLLG